MPDRAAPWVQTAPQAPRAQMVLPALRPQPTQSVPRARTAPLARLAQTTPPAQTALLAPRVQTTPPVPRALTAQTVPPAPQHPWRRVDLQGQPR